MVVRQGLSCLVRSALQQRRSQSARTFSRLASTSLSNDCAVDGQLNKNQEADGQLGEASANAPDTVTTAPGELGASLQVGVKDPSSRSLQSISYVGAQEKAPSTFFQSPATRMGMSTMATAQQTRSEAPDLSQEQLAALGESLDAMWRRGADVSGDVGVPGRRKEQGLDVGLVPEGGLAADADGFREVSSKGADGASIGSI